MRKSKDHEGRLGHIQFQNNFTFPRKLTWTFSQTHFRIQLASSSLQQKLGAARPLVDSRKPIYSDKKFQLHLPNKSISQWRFYPSDFKAMKNFKYWRASLFVQICKLGKFKTISDLHANCVHINQTISALTGRLFVNRRHKAEEAVQTILLFKLLHAIFRYNMFTKSFDGPTWRMRDSPYTEQRILCVFRVLNEFCETISLLAGFHEFLIQ